MAKKHDVKVIGIALVAQLCLFTTAFAQEFHLDVKQADARAMAGGSIALDVIVTYLGRKPLTWLSITPDELRRSILKFGVPRGWKDRFGEQPPRGIEVGGLNRVPYPTINQGDKVYHRIYLQDYFSEVVPGTHTLTVTYTRGGGSGTTEIILHLVPFDEQRFTMFVDSVLKKVQDKKLPQDDRRRVLDEVYYLLHPNLSKVYFAMLKDKSHFWDKSGVYRAFARNAAQFEECKKELLSYLSAEADDEYCVAVLNELRRIGGENELPEEYVDVMLDSKSERVRHATEKFISFVEEIKKRREHLRALQKIPEREQNKTMPTQPHGTEEDEPVAVEKAEPPQAEVEQKGGWLFVPGLIAAGVVIAGVVLFLLLRRRR